MQLDLYCVSKLLKKMLFLDETHFETKQLEISKLSLTPEAM